MYGTLMRLKIKVGQREKVQKHFESWEDTRQPRTKGAKGGVMLAPDGNSDELVGIAVFEDEETYRANAEDPEQHQWYTSLRELLEKDPEWEDGEVVWARVV